MRGLPTFAFRKALPLCVRALYYTLNAAIMPRPVRISVVVINQADRAIASRLIAERG